MKQRILSCDWEITTNCNLHCLHCINNHFYANIKTSNCFKIIDYLSNRGCKSINFTGGEPLTRKDIFKIIKYARDKGIKCRILTNGLLITKENISKIKKWISYVGISLEGLEKENDSIRGKGSFKKTLKSIELLKNKKIRFGIYTVLTKYNKIRFKEFLINIGKKNPANISLNELVVRGRTRKNKKQIYYKPVKKEIINILKEVFPQEKFREEKGCLINTKRIFLNPVGKVYLCTEIYQNNPRAYVGDLSKDLYNKINRPKINKCRYYSIASNKISLNLISQNYCLLK